MRAFSENTIGYGMAAGIHWWLGLSVALRRVTRAA
jgi:hypothetical protein